MPSLQLTAQADFWHPTSGRHWIVITGGDLPYPVAMSIGIASGGRPRCTGLMIGLDGSGDAPPPDAGTRTAPADIPDTLRATFGDPSARPTPDSARVGITEITSASLRHVKIPELLQAIWDASDSLHRRTRVTAAELVDLAGPDYDPADWKSSNGGKTYELPPLISYSGPRKGRPFLDQLYPGMVPDIPPAPPRIPGQALPRWLFEHVAEEYRRALDTHSRAPMQELTRRLGIKPNWWSGNPAPEPTARRWVQRARDLGLLGPSRPGVPGEYPEDGSR